MMSHHNELNISQGDEFFSDKQEKQSDESLQATRERKGIKILKILLLNILLFNKRVVQASTAAYAIHNVYEKGQIMWIMIFFSHNYSRS